MRQTWKSGALALTLAVGAHLALFSLDWPELPNEPAPEPPVTIELEPSAPHAAETRAADPQAVVTTKGESSHRITDPAPAEPSPTPDKPVAQSRAAPPAAASQATATTDPAPRQAPSARPENKPAQQRPPQAPDTARATAETAPAAREVAVAPAAKGQSTAPAMASGNRAEGSGVDPEAIRQGYRQRLESHLNQYQRYPVNAQRKRQTGTVEVAFVIDRQGHLVSSTLLNRTPFPLLNHEALALLKRAVPFPPIPDSLTGDQLHWELPIHFRLN